MDHGGRPLGQRELCIEHTKGRSNEHAVPDCLSKTREQGELQTSARKRATCSCLSWARLFGAYSRALDFNP
jgi:hypothetical protein